MQTTGGFVGGGRKVAVKVVVGEAIWGAVRVGVAGGGTYKMLPAISELALERQFPCRSKSVETSYFKAISSRVSSNMTTTGNHPAGGGHDVGGGKVAVGIGDVIAVVPGSGLAAGLAGGSKVREGGSAATGSPFSTMARERLPSSIATDSTAPSTPRAAWRSSVTPATPQNLLGATSIRRQRVKGG